MEISEGTFEDEGDASENVLIAMHPRWCSACALNRTGVMNDGLAQRLQKINQTTYGELARIKQKAYVEGVVQGRIHALTAPMNETDNLAHEISENTDHGVDELVDMLHAAQLQPDDEKDVVGLMMRCRLKVDETGWSEAAIAELEYALDIALLEGRCESKGFEDGKRLQARMEKHAVEESDWDKRQALLEHALL
jgi:hypothetical protein